MLTSPLSRPPTQRRSQDTLARYYAAGRALFAAQPVSAVTVPALAAAARSSVGSFYTRFADRDEFLEFFYRSYYDGMRARLLEEWRAALDAAADVGQLARSLVRCRVEHYVRERALLRNLLVHVRLTGDRRFSAAGREITDTLVGAVHESLDARAVAIERPALRNALLMADAALREYALFGRGARTSAASIDAAFGRDVAWALALVLRSPPPARWD